MYFCNYEHLFVQNIHQLSIARLPGKVWKQDRGGLGDREPLCFPSSLGQRFGGDHAEGKTMGAFLQDKPG